MYKYNKFIVLLKNINIEYFSPIYFLAVKMSLSEISRIKLNYRAILILTAVVSEKLTNLTIDTDMKCSINALWSLTGKNIIKLVVIRYELIVIINFLLFIK